MRLWNDTCFRVSLSRKWETWEAISEDEENDEYAVTAFGSGNLLYIQGAWITKKIHVNFHVNFLFIQPLIGWWLVAIQ